MNKNIIVEAKKAADRFIKVNQKIQQVIDEKGEGKVIIHIKHCEISGCTKITDDRFGKID